MLNNNEKRKKFIVFSEKISKNLGFIEIHNPPSCPSFKRPQRIQKTWPQSADCQTTTDFAKN